MTKTQEALNGLTAKQLQGLRMLARFYPLEATWTGGEFTADVARSLAAYGCVRILSRQKVGLGFKLQVKITPLGKAVYDAL